MSCGSSYPPATTLRIEAARVAVEITRGGKVGDWQAAANHVFEFLSADLAADELAGTTQADKARAINDRNTFANGPLAAMVMLREPVIDRLESAGIMQPGALVQESADEVRALGLNDRAMALLESELRARGLSLGMTTDEVRHWIKTGAAHGAQS